jgi:hypothetical protein
MWANTVSTLTFWCVLPRLGFFSCISLWYLVLQLPSTSCYTSFHASSFWWLTCTTVTLYWRSTCIVARFHHVNRLTLCVCFFSGRGRCHKCGIPAQRSPPVIEVALSTPTWLSKQQLHAWQPTGNAQWSSFTKCNITWKTELLMRWHVQIHVTECSGVCSFMIVKWNWK